MFKVKLVIWNSSTKVIKVKSGSQVITLKATSSLFTRMLLFARSSREDIDLQQVIGTHEFSHVNEILMLPFKAAQK